VVCGYGDVGKGSSHSLRGMGARVIVTEIDPINALQAAMEGFEVATNRGHAGARRHLCTCTGNLDIITLEHMKAMKDQALCATSATSIRDSDGQAQPAAGVKKINIKPQVDQYNFPADGNKPAHSIFVLAEGRLVNLGCATGHPSFVMSNSFSNQTLAQLIFGESRHVRD